MNYEERLKHHPAELLEQLVTDLKKKKAIDIRFEYEENDQWSIVTTHIGEEDAEISLRMHANSLYELYLGYYDDEDELREHVLPLNGDQISVIPKTLQKTMAKVLNDEEGLRIPGNLLLK